MPELTERYLREIGGHEVFNRARAAHRSGRVTSAVWDPPLLKGFVASGKRGFRAILKIDEKGNCENHCTCPEASLWGQICEHVVAVGIALLEKAPAAAEQERPAEAPVPGGAAVSRAGGAAAGGRAAAGAPPARLGLARRVVAEEETGASARLRLRLIFPPDARSGLERDRLMLNVEAEHPGGRALLQAVPRGMTYAVDAPTDRVLQFLAELTEGEPHGTLMLRREHVARLLSLAAPPVEMRCGRATPLAIADPPVRCAVELTLDADRRCARLGWRPRWAPPFAAAGTRVLLTAPGECWVWSGTTVARVLPALPAEWERLYRGDVTIEAPELPRFLLRDLPVLRRAIEVESDPPLAAIEVRPGRPQFALALDGGRTRLVAQLEAVYGVSRFTLGRGRVDPEELVPDPGRPGAWALRDPAAEGAALGRLKALGFMEQLPDGRWRMGGEERVLNFLGAGLPPLRRAGWTVGLTERVEACLAETERLHISVALAPAAGVAPGGTDWLQMQIAHRSESGERFTDEQVMTALRRGQGYLKGRSGKFVLIDAGAVEAVCELVAETGARAESAAGAYRLRGLESAYVAASLSEFGDVELAAAPELRRHLAPERGQERVERVPLEPALDRLLRGYQKEGTAWLAFLRRNGLGGILADEMGLGKTVQVLALIDAERRRARDAGAPFAPSLVVCPTSLVENWRREAARFTPALRVLMLHGPERRALLADLDRAELAITSYALLRRDVDEYRERPFEFVILDEAQHIKNRQTRNAQAARLVRGRTRLVLTGTPVENSPADLWSMMDFVIPGYLGSHREFRERYVQPLRSLTGEEQVALGRRLARRVRPFLLRRRKADVASELPPKVEQVAGCGLVDEQAELYRKVLEASRKEVFDTVMARGMEASRVVILTALTRLRQICCHPSLLPIEGVTPAMRSGKVELFEELLDEALDSGHRVLVFSQFVRMLALLRQRLDARGIGFAYLDGSTVDRMGEVDRFTRSLELPVFLISLRAGGTGLNLEAADTVIHFDPWWNPAVEQQATDRAHRIGQTRAVHSIRLITQGTVEERILELQERKRALASVLVDEAGGGQLDLTYEDLERLFE